MTETGHDTAAGAQPGQVRRARRTALTGLLTVAAVWLTWWVAATLTDRTGHAEATYLVVFVGGPIAVVVTLVALAVAGGRIAGELRRRRARDVIRGGRSGSSRSGSQDA